MDGEGRDVDGNLSGPIRRYNDAEPMYVYPSMPPEIATALVEAQRAVNKIAKGKTADVRSKGGGGFSYDFVGHGELIDEGRSAGHEAGLALSIPTWRLVEERHTVALCCWLVHTSGASWRVTPDPEMPVCEGPGRPIDKATAAALTYCQRYIWNQLLQIPRVDKGAEVNQRDDADHVPEKRAPSKGGGKGKGSRGPDLNGTILMGPSKGTPLADVDSSKLTKWVDWLAMKGIRPDHMDECEKELLRRLDQEASGGDAGRDEHEADDPAHP